MSHLTASPFHKPKPTPFEFPQRSSSAETVPVPAAQLPTPASVVGADPRPVEYFEIPAASVSPEAPGSRFRRVASSIGYHNSGLRESRERTVQRSSRSFVVVLPPPSFPQDHGHLGHTLASGPRHRLSQGLLMPLFPTMYGQLTAIAREYNFPSTAGLCLYLHFTEHGITATPRISDDSWQMIWNHAFDPTATPTHTSLPISGKIEFDIDMRLARWYGAWMASSHREHVDVPMSVTPSAAPSIIHYREESRTTFADGDEQDNQSVARPARHVPRKLSLIDRFDAMSARSVPRSVVARAPPPQEQHPESQNLSPIFQEDEPKTAKYDLEHRVNSWRASASILPGAMAIAEAGHILMSGANLLNSPPIEESPMVTSNGERPDGEYEYRIEDYSFSISSAGPGDYDPHSPLTWYYDPSVHLAHRAQGSVCMTPSVCTSFGPSDYELPPDAYAYDPELAGVRTPDIAHRMFEEVPPSPSVATSWGAPLSYPPSPTSEHRARSVHLEDRLDFSRAVTPMTATSWGAPESFPPSPTTPFYVRTPDAGQRTFDISALADHDTPWGMVWPYHDSVHHHSAQDEEREEGNGENEHSENGTRDMVWPHQLEKAVAPWGMVWPSHVGRAGQSTSASAATREPITIRLARAYPGFDLYPATYPDNLDEIYPSTTVDAEVTASYPDFVLYPPIGQTRTSSVSARGPITIRLAPVYPGFDLYPVTYPGNLDEIYPSTNTFSTEVSASYPDFVLYPPIGQTRTSSVSARGPITIRLAPVYPGFDLYPVTYPGNLDEIYPSTNTFSTEVSASYPDFVLYPPIGQTRTSSVSARGPITIRLAPVYPGFDLYPATYPGNLYEIYPSTNTFSTEVSASYPDFVLYSPIGQTRTSSVSARGPITIRLAPVYPGFDLYPATYPDNLDEIYPSTTVDAGSTISTRLSDVAATSTIYPSFQLYPSASDVEIYPLLPEDCAVSQKYASYGFPYFNLYPPVGGSITIVFRPMTYPNLVLYPAVYPHFDLYGEQASLYEEDYGSQSNSDLVATPAIYPSFQLYPAASGVEIYPLLPEDCAVSQKYASYGFPYFNLYPPAGGPITIISHPMTYPNLILYPAVYPYFDLYEEVLTKPLHEQRGIDIRVQARYPYISLYAAVYPHFDLWPTLSSLESPRIPTQSRFTRSDLHELVKKSTLNTQFGARAPSKTHQTLHMAVFPDGADVLTPSGAVPTIIRSLSKTHLDLHLAVFPSGVDFSTPSGTGALKDAPSPVPAHAPAPVTPTPPRTLRVRSGSVLRMSLPPSPRPVGGRSPVVRASPVLPPPNAPIPAAPTAAPTAGLRRTVSSATRPTVGARAAGAPLTRPVSMAPRSSVAELTEPASVNGPRAPPRRQNSVVMQRVRAMQQMAEAPIEEDALASFPLPPRQPIRKVVS
ncbi:hypothetical protein DFH07DRAFT_229079 [Mycena maculata]|uniref:Uncharacterized protein n=1 Tax=Mycena maculata TaxID=230809 RepID=A0AAD7NRB9_9AGAR|nr:hypothetical protein DFH07DRAFT_229079 [Mycena maculata]